MAPHPPPFDVGAVMFDLDGTLIDTMQAFADLAGRLIERDYGLSFPEARTAYLRTSGIPFAHQLEQIFPGNHRNHAVQDEFERRKQDAFFATRPDPDTVATVARLRTGGLKVAVSSNNYEPFVERWFAAHPELATDLTLGFRDGFAKGPAHLECARQRFDLPAGRILFVGDSIHDGVLAADLGMPFTARLGTRGAEEFEAVLPGCVCVERLSGLLPLVGLDGPTPTEGKP